MSSSDHPTDIQESHHAARMDEVIDLAWADEISFEEINARTGLAEKDVIRVMRRHLKPASFRRWRERVSGRVTKHQKRLRSFRSIPSDDD